MSDSRQNKDKDQAEDSTRMDMFEIIESIVPLCDAGKAFVRGDYPDKKPVIGTFSPSRPPAPETSCECTGKNSPRR